MEQSDMTAPGLEYQDPLENYDPRSFSDPIERALHEEKVTAIQTRPVTAIPPETTVEQALRTLAGLEIACVLVAREGRLLGLFSERDVLDKVAERYEELKDKPITEVMTPDPVYVYESDRAGKALCVMAVSGYRHVPVVDVNERILGIVSPLRVMRFLQSRCEGR